jgi:uncharacterized FlaG/YvyC family protein
MSENGWIKLHRSLKDKAIWKCSTPEQKTILITLLMMANHKPKEWEWRGKKFMCHPGQLITSLDSIKKEAGKGISVQGIRSSLQRFEKYEFLTNESTKTGRLVTIINWESYQSHKKNQQSNQQRGNKEVTTNKNDKNDKKKEKIYRKEKVEMTETEYNKLVEKLGANLTNQYIEDLNLYMLSHGKRYKSHYATVLAWYRKDEREGKTRIPVNQKHMSFEEKVLSDTR